MVRIAILTASDTGFAGGRLDASGDLAQSRCQAAGHEVVARTILADERAALAARLRAWSDENAADIIITTGGTGFTARDITPEATRDVAEREAPGIAIALAFEGLKKTPFAVLSRGIAVLRKRTLIVNLPGNPKAVDEGLDVLLPLLPHIQQLLAGPMEHRTGADSGHAS